jgi:glycine/D-amino acid oxidase-like deaminating enzyme
VLIGSCRQFAGLDRSVDPVILGRMIEKARRYIPSIASLQVLRVWTGFRPASPDDRPWIGPIPGRSGLWIASGHEGLGITSAMGTAELLADLVFGSAPHVSPALYLPAGRIGVAAGSGGA